jgi:hypothetical protein
MERIKEAIQKAKSQTPPPAAPPPAQRETVRVAPSELDQIVYRETRVVALDPNHLEANRIVALDKNDVRVAPFDLLRTQVVRKLRENHWSTLAVTSPDAGCGKTVVAINLAISLAQQTDQTVLLADFDLRRPKVAAYLGLSRGPSLLDYLEGREPLSGVLVNPGIPRLVVLPNDRAIANAAETLTAAKVKALVEDLKERYASRLVIFDLPPLLATDDTLGFLPSVDAVLLVVGNHQTTKSEIEQSQHLLRSANLMGVVLNRAEVKRHGYY